LRQRLRQQAATTSAGSSAEKQGARVAQYHQRASIWFEAHGLTVDALRHALAAEDFARTANLLECTWRAMDDSRQSARWLRWVQQLPAELIRARPVLSAACGWALLDSGALEAADTHLRDAERWQRRVTERAEDAQEATAAMVVADQEELQALPATIAAARTYYALALGDLAGTQAYAQQALALLPADNYLRRGVPAALLGLAYWTSGDLALAQRTFAEAMVSFQKAGNTLFAITGTYILADMLRVQGQLHRAIEICQQSLQWTAAQGELVRRGSADLYTGLSELACEQGDLATALAHLQRSAALGEQAPLPRWRYRWSLAQASLKQAQGELDGALAVLAEAEQAYVRGPVPDVRPLAAQKARVWILQGRLTAAVAWAQEQGLSADDDLRYLREYEHITLARLLIARYRSERATPLLDDALTLLTRLLAAAEAGKRMGSVIEILLLQALAHAAKDNCAAAQPPLQRALLLAEPEGYVRLFANEGVALARLLAEIPPEDVTPDYIARVLTAVGVKAAPKDAVPPQPAPGSSPTAQPLIEPLSERELEVLHLVAQGLSNREISERLFIALNTVKGHNRVIFGKLQVSRRTEAVARARELGLVQG
ncbi:MAG: hypothetical protein KDE58_39700, partial [Caldilineaceae bacterium]|nr:hypothetical protein [Caldilineaceae bacterium]